MAFRGRGRGRGWGGFGRSFGRQEKFVLFPDIELPDVKVTKDEKEMWLVSEKSKLQLYWRSSAYFMDETAPKDSSEPQSTEIERFSDRLKQKVRENRGPLSQYLELNSDNFPRELLPLKRLGGDRPSRKKVRWNVDSGSRKVDLFEKVLQKYEGQEDKLGKVKKEGEKEIDEEDDGGPEEAEEEEFSDDGDYNQNIDFDDDEDDFNMEDDQEDEAIYD